MIAKIQAEYKSDAGSTNDTPYLTLVGELWGAFCKYFRDNWLCYNDTALYVNVLDIQHYWAEVLTYPSSVLWLMSCHFSVNLWRESEKQSQKKVSEYLSSNWKYNTPAIFYCPSFFKETSSR